MAQNHASAHVKPKIDGWLFNNENKRENFRSSSSFRISIYHIYIFIHHKSNLIAHLNIKVSCTCMCIKKFDFADLFAGCCNNIYFSFLGEQPSLSGLSESFCGFRILLFVEKNHQRQTFFCYFFSVIEIYLSHERNTVFISPLKNLLLINFVYVRKICKFYSSRFMTHDCVILLSRPIKTDHVNGILLISRLLSPKYNIEIVISEITDKILCAPTWNKQHRFLKKLRKKTENELEKNVSQSDQNVLKEVIGPVELREINYFATWWHLVAREHDLIAKFQFFRCESTLKN